MTQPAQKPGESKQDYATPDVFIEAVKRRLHIERFAFDFAADPSNAKAARWWGEHIDSLSMPASEWGAKCAVEWGWLNPPFAKIGPWAKRCAEVVRDHYGSKIALLVPAAVGSNWYRDYVHRAHARVLFLNGRIPFMPDKPKWLYPKDCILVLYQFGNQGSDVWTWRDSARQQAGEGARADLAVGQPTDSPTCPRAPEDPSSLPSSGAPHPARTEA